MKKIYGVGINDAPYKVYQTGRINGKQINLWTCPFYQAWTGMLERCYSERLHSKRPTYIGCTAYVDWHKFSSFRGWMENQPWENSQLDKDILIPGNKVYAPDTCIFISHALNCFLTDHGRARGDFAIGVQFKHKARKFRSRCWNPFAGKRELLGDFLTEEEAHEAWRRRKHRHACAYADQQTDQRIAAALRERFFCGEQGEIYAS